MIAKARAQTPVHIIMWITSFLATMIAITWYTQQIRPLSQEFELAQTDLLALQQALNVYCQDSTPYFQTLYNPVTQSGTLNITANNITIATFKNRYHMPLLCELQFAGTPSAPNQVGFDLATTSYIKITKEAGKIEISTV